MHTKFEQYCENVASASFGVPVDSLKGENRGIDIAAILAFIETIATIIKTVTDMCPNKSNFAKVAKNPTWAQRILFKAEVRKGFSDHENWQLRRMGIKAANAALTEAGKMTEEELQGIVDELELIDNAVI